MAAEKELAEWKVWALGILCLAPVLLLTLGCFVGAIVDLESATWLDPFAVLFVFFLWLVLPVLTLLLIFRIWRRAELSTSAKFSWTVGLLFFAVLSVPYYWYKFHWQPYRAKKRYSDV